MKREGPSPMELFLTKIEGRIRELESEISRLKVVSRQEMTRVQAAPRYRSQRRANAA